MDQKEKQFQSLNVCHRIYHLMKFLVRHAHKTVTSGSSMPRWVAQAPAICNEASSMSVQQVHPLAQTTIPVEGQQAMTTSNDQDEGRKYASEIEAIGAFNIAFAAHSEENKKPDEEATLPSNSSQPKAPKKMVSINENVETINTRKKKKDKKKKEQAMLDEPKPLKSILKVASDVNNTIDSQSHSLLIRANGA